MATVTITVEVDEKDRVRSYITRVNKKKGVFAPTGSPETMTPTVRRTTHPVNNHFTWHKSHDKKLMDYYKKGWSCKKIARRLGRSQSAVWTRRYQLIHATGEKAAKVAAHVS